MRLILLGPPGAGKGTQAKLLAAKLNIPHISTGDILRDAMRENSELGLKVAGFVQSGELVPDPIVVEVVINRLTQPDAQDGFILDGFPRTLKQAQELSASLRHRQISIDLVIYLATSSRVSIRRLSGRRVCKDCGANFHLTNMPPKKDGICNFCGGALYLREDDREETVKKRLDIYQQQTASLIDYYEKEGKLRKISADRQANTVFTQLMEMFADGDVSTTHHIPSAH